jgi:spectinomycin phosphotransferase
LPDELELDAVIEPLADGWDFDVTTAEYAAIGGGSYHWIVTDPTGEQRFVTVDDLDRKPWLGDTPSSVFVGLGRAFDTAVALRETGLEFVLAPVRAGDGASVTRIGPRYTLAVFPFVKGEAGRFGEYRPSDRAALVPMLAELHRATPTSGARRLDLALAGRAWLEQALSELDRVWDTGPLAEPARKLLARHAPEVAELLALADRLSAEITPDGWVVTHGEPHAANLIETANGHLLIDWDTVALAPPERDLWMLVDDDAGAGSRYEGATARRLDSAALDFFRLMWDLSDLVGFTNVMRSPHGDNADTRKAYEALTVVLGGYR